MKSELFKRPLIHSRADAKTQITIERNENCFQDYEVKKVCKLEFPIMLEKEELDILDICLPKDPKQYDSV